MGQPFRFKSRRGSSRSRSFDSQWLGTLFCRVLVVAGIGLILSSLRSPTSTPLFQSVGSSSLPLSHPVDKPAPLDFAAPAVAPLPEEIQPDRNPRRSGTAQPISVSWQQISGVPVYLTQINLQDPETFISIGLANRAKTANSPRSSRGDEHFTHLVRHQRAALTLSGTFFSMDRQKRVMGNMVAAGQFLKYSPWENYGTTLGLRAGNRPELVTARVQGKPQWQHHWFSLTAGPRLLWQGKIYVNPKREGFTDPAVMGVALRSAIGFPKSGHKLLHVTFLKPISLQKEAQIMRDLGCYEAMNLDGGTSVAIARGNRILKSAGRELTNVITVYDVNYPAPKDLRLSWYAFQNQQENLALSPIQK